MASPESPAPTEQQRREGFEAMCAIMQRDGAEVPSCVFCDAVSTGFIPSAEEPGKVTLACGPCGRRAAMRVVR